MKNRKYPTDNDDVKIYKPQPEVIPAFTTFPLVDCLTDEFGYFYNPYIENIELCKKETDDNHK